MFLLRVALLRNQNRRDDLESFLLNVASRTTSLEVLAQVENTARVDGFPKVQQSSIEKQIVLMTDPVEKMRLRLALARFEEGQGQARKAPPWSTPSIRRIPRSSASSAPPSIIIGAIRTRNARSIFWRRPQAIPPQPTARPF